MAENKESKEVATEKSSSAFSLQKDLEKVKILVPLTELMKQPTYQSQVTSFMLPPKVEHIPDSLNLQEEIHMVIFGPHVEELDASTPPFYVSLVIHDLLLHNCMLDLGASHNLLPLSVMEQLGLQITRSYKDLYSFDSKRVKCLGMIKDLEVNLAQIPAKSVVMDIVVADIPARFGMLLSRSWGTKIGGSIKLDLTYATILIFGGQERRLYRETRFVKTFTKADNSVNSPVYSKEEYFSCLMLEEVQDYAHEPSFC